MCSPKRSVSARRARTRAHSRERSSVDLRAASMADITGMIVYRSCGKQNKNAACCSYWGGPYMFKAPRDPASELVVPKRTARNVVASGQKCGCARPEIWFPHVQYASLAAVQAAPQHVEIPPRHLASLRVFPIVGFPGQQSPQPRTYSCIN